MLGLALEQLPAEDLDREILVRTDIGGATHAFTADCRDAGIRFSVGYELTETVRAAILEVPETAWRAGDQRRRRGPRRRLGRRADRPPRSVRLARGIPADLPPRTAAPRRAVQIFDEHGYRHTCFLTDQDGNDIAALELRHRGRARVEDSIRAGKDTGMRNLPHHAFEHNQTWLELSLIAQDLLSWTKLICLTGELATAEPKRLRQRLLHTAAKLVRHGRRTRLKLDRDWPWAAALAAAFTTAARDPGALLSTHRHRGHDITTDPQHPTSPPARKRPPRSQHNTARRPSQASPTPTTVSPRHSHPRDRTAVTITTITALRG